MSKYIKLIRLPNLLLLVISIFLYGRNILYPTLVSEGIFPRLVTKDFLSVLFVVMCMAAAGYVHNDITDVLTDRSNKKRGTISEGIKISVAWSVYIFLIVAPLPLLYYLSTEAENLMLLLWYGVIHAFLLLYNRYLQKLPLIGNIVVATLCGLAVITPYFIETIPLQELHSINMSKSRGLFRFTFAIAIFAGLSNFIREIIKDVEDMNGDSEASYQTLPILYGVRTSKYVIITVKCILLVGIIYWLESSVRPLATELIQGSLLLPPLVFLIVRTFMAKSQEDFGVLSQLVKIYFAIGVVALLVLMP